MLNKTAYTEIVNCDIHKNLKSFRIANKPLSNRSQNVTRTDGMLTYCMQMKNTRLPWNIQHYKIK